MSLFSRNILPKRINVNATLIRKAILFCCSTKDLNDLQSDSSGGLEAVGLILNERLK
ncbi:hypothetical protein MKW92_038186, partial [Papaver armeniacum]